MGTHGFFVHESIVVVAKFRGVVETKEDGHIWLGSVEHPVGKAFALQAQLEWSGQIQELVRSWAARAS